MKLKKLLIVILTSALFVGCGDIAANQNNSNMPSGDVQSFENTKETEEPTVESVEDLTQSGDGVMGGDVELNVDSNDTQPEEEKVEIGKVVLFGSYEQDNVEDNGKEAIKWYVLDMDEEKILLLAVDLLDSVPYHETQSSVTWETCTLRQWMNDDFYNSAFTEEEKNLILTSKLVNEMNGKDKTPGGNDTDDKVFSLSSGEASKYFGYKSVAAGGFWDTKDKERSTAKVTAYALAKNAELSVNDEGYGRWWLRSPGMESTYAVCTLNGNTVCENGGDVNATNKAVRPAVWVTWSENDSVIKIYVPESTSVGQNL